jgi:predicted deacylase
MKDLTVGDITVAKGSKQRGKLGTFHLADGSAVTIPLMVVNGVEDGPVLWLSAAMHGQELSGIGVIWEIMNEQFDPTLLRGAVVAVPLLNPFSFTGGTYFTPQDGYNLHNAFPGDPKGGLTERMAHVIIENGIKHADVIIDLHCNPETAMMFTLAFGPDESGIGTEGHRLANSFGLTNVDRSPKSVDSNCDMTDVAYHLGKPSFIVELTPYYSIDPRAVEIGVRGVLNVMKSLQMIDGEIEAQEGVLVIEGRLDIVFTTSNSGGFVMPDTPLGDPVEKGGVVGRVVDYFGDTVEEIRSPVDGWMLAWPFLNQSVYEGDLLAFYVYPKDE